MLRERERVRGKREGGGGKEGETGERERGREGERGRERMHGRGREEDRHRGRMRGTFWRSGDSYIISNLSYKTSYTVYQTTKGQIYQDI